jgi:transcriptional regulator with XRE-family HTH domain
MSETDKYNAPFAAHLRFFLASHPDTGVKTTQAALAAHLGVRPQTVAYYVNGESLPNCNQLQQIAEFFKVTCDFLMTGRRMENKPVCDMLGLSDDTVQRMRLVNENYREDTPSMPAILDCLLGEKDFYEALARVDSAYSKKEMSKIPQCPDCGGRLPFSVDDDITMYHEWKASNYLHGFLMEFFRQNLTSIHNKKTDYNGNREDE